MPRKPRVEYPGAMYHVMSRGDRREDISLDGVDRQDFIMTLAEGRQKTGRQVHACCLMRNQYRLALVAHMAMNLHRQCATVAVAEPTGDGGNVLAGFNAAGCEQMTQVVVGDSGDGDSNVRGGPRRVDSPGQIFGARLRREWMCQGGTSLSGVHRLDRGGDFLSRRFVQRLAVFPPPGKFSAP